MRGGGGATFFLTMLWTTGETAGGGAGDGLGNEGGEGSLVLEEKEEEIDGPSSSGMIAPKASMRAFASSGAARRQALRFAFLEGFALRLVSKLVGNCASFPTSRPASS